MLYFLISLKVIIILFILRRRYIQKKNLVIITKKLNSFSKIPDDLENIKIKGDKQTTDLITSLNNFIDLIIFNFKIVTKSEKDFRLISEKAIDGIITIDEDNTIIFANKSIFDILGFSQNELLNMSILKLFPFQVHSFLLTMLNNLKSTSKDGIGLRFEINGLNKSREQIPLELSISTNQYTNYNTYTAIIRDITIRKELEDQLKVYTENLEKLIEMRTEELSEQNIALDEANKQLKKLDELKSNFLSNISHELRTPLTSIKSSAKIIDKYGEKKPESIKKFASIIIEEADRLTRLINNVLDLSKIEAGEMKFDFKPVNMYQLLEHIFTITNPFFVEKKIKYLISIPKNIPNVLIDKDSIIQVIVNLISNAVKFTENGFVKISIIISQQGKKLKFEVEDSGIGIAKEDIEQIFEKFKQSGDTLINKPKGTGLGLHISREIIQQHGGIIWAESELGKGSKFIFTIPCETNIDTNNKEIKDKKNILIISKETGYLLQDIDLKINLNPIIINSSYYLKNILKKYNFEKIIIDNSVYDSNEITKEIKEIDEKFLNKICSTKLFYRNGVLDIDEFTGYLNRFMD